jgi:hypothetical protein
MIELDTVVASDFNYLQCGSRGQFQSRDWVKSQDSYGQCSGSQGKIDPSAYSTYQLVLTTGEGNDYCQGFLDNLHGNCGLGITNYQCGVKDGQAGITFNAPTTCLGKSIEGAIWNTNGVHLGGVTCAWHKDWPPAAGSGVAQYGTTALQVLFDLLGFAITG